MIIIVELEIVSKVLIDVEIEVELDVISFGIN